MKFHPQVIKFFKKHNLYNEEVFNYLSENALMIDYTSPEETLLIGTFYEVDKQERTIQKIHMIIPYVTDDITMLMNIHEIVHGIELYQYLNKQYTEEIDKEALPLLYERIYILESEKQSLYDYGYYLDSLITPEDKSYYFGLSIREKLLKHYNYNYSKMKKLTKKLMKKR